MHTTIHISNDSKRAIMLRSHHDRSKPRKKPSNRVPRKQAVYGTKSYFDGLQRAFNNAKMQLYFNQDMNNFITLTYAQEDNTIEQVLYDIKQLIRTEQRARAISPDEQSGAKTAKYLYIMEYQKRGSIHVHMIANNFFTLQVNRNGYRELKYWRKGFSSVLTINDFDNNFRPYLYLFKYMKKSQRIGKSFVHTSRNLKNYTKTTDPIDLQNWNTVNLEYTHTQIETTELHYFKNYLAWYNNDTTLNPEGINP